MSIYYFKWHQHFQLHFLPLDHYSLQIFLYYPFQNLKVAFYYRFCMQLQVQFYFLNRSRYSDFFHLKPIYIDQIFMCLFKLNSKQLNCQFQISNMRNFHLLI